MFRYGVDYLPRYCYQNQSISSHQLKESAQCIQEQHFVWGLSSLLVKIMLALQMVWTLGTFLVWLDANLYSELCRNSRKIRGPFGATLDLSGAMREVLGDETCADSEAELAAQLIHQPGLRYFFENIQHRGTSRVALSSVRLRNVDLDGSKLYGTGCELG